MTNAATTIEQADRRPKNTDASGSFHRKPEACASPGTESNSRESTHASGLRLNGGSGSFQVRAATPQDFIHVHARLPASLEGTPAARHFLATEAATGTVVGVAALRIFIDRAGRFELFVDPAFRRRGCGTALWDAVRQAACRENVTDLLTGQAYQPDATDSPTTAAIAFLRALGLTVLQEIVNYRAELSAALRVLEPLYERCPLASGTRIVPIDQVDAGQLAMFVVKHVGGLPEDLAAKLSGQHAESCSPATSLVAITHDEITGSILTLRVADTLMFESRAIAGGHRGGGINLALMCLSARQAASEGIRSIEFESDIRGNDTVKLARRFSAEEIGRRQCWGETLETTAPVIAPDRVTCEPMAAVAPSVQPTLTSQHTSSFAELLAQLGISVAVTTYQAGKLLLLREVNGTINTHFRSFSKPMGLALDGNRLAIGTAVEIWEFHNAPAVGRRAEGRGLRGEGEDNVEGTVAQPRIDACFLPRGSHTTGDIQIHEMCWVDEEGRGVRSERLPFTLAPQPSLWFINTRFSCLCTRDVNYSFVPRWRPPFISAIAPEDRCHLNGFCVVPADRRAGGRQPPDSVGDVRFVSETHDVRGLTPSGSPSCPSFFVTALGETDTPGGWRGNKRSGGLLMETGSNEVLLRGLSMPHSPRVFNNQLWVCESGTGTFGRVDLQAGRYEPIASLPGFTRGVDFHGRYAFIGLSQVRESAVFSGIPIAERPISERACGVWVIDMVTGQTVAWLKFDDGVQEIFAVTVLPNSRCPDVINDDRKLIGDSFILPDESLASVPDDLRFVEVRS